MKMIRLLLCILPVFSLAQDYDSYLTGDAEDVQPQPIPGTVLMGGAGENDEAMKWFLERANGGDVVVIRASGSDGYNDYMYSDLGVTVNSVETIVFNNEAAASDGYVLQQIQNAEAIWMAGGNQWDYVSYWKDNDVEAAINALRNDIGGPVGGISAGMAVLGGSYFTAENGTVFSDECLQNPYNDWLQLGHDDFLEMPYMGNVVCDTHYDDPDRRGRHVGFMARMYADEGKYPLGIACDEYSAVCIDENGIAWCYGEYPDFDDWVYFIRPNCAEPIGPEVCSEGNALDWNLGGQALKVYRVSSTLLGDQFLDLNDWLTAFGGVWQTWFVDDGDIQFVEDGVAPDCAVGVPEMNPVQIEVWPVPATSDLSFNLNQPRWFRVFDTTGQIIDNWSCQIGTNQIDVSEFSAGVYAATDAEVTFRFIVE